MNTHNQNKIVMPGDCYKLYMDIRNELEKDPNVNSNLKTIISRYEDIKPRAAERISNVTELLFELEQRQTVRYISGYVYIFHFYKYIDIKRYQLRI